jgi:hypothetical protein
LNIREAFETTKGSKLGIFAQEIMCRDAYARKEMP